MVRLGTAEGRWVILGMVLGSAATFLNATVVNIALPSISDDLGADLAGLQWVVNGYLVALSALVLVGGSAGDIYGRKRVFLYGLGIFTLSSLACALAGSLTQLVVARVVQGVGAAAMTPASLAIVDASFVEEDRSQAVGAWASGSALAAGLGPFLGGWLVDAVDWRWVFVLSIPLSLASAVATVLHVPESRDDRPGRHLDLTGAALAAAAISGLVYALVQAPNDGWLDPLVFICLVIGIGATGLFLATQRSIDDPMLPLRLFAVRQFSGTNLLTLSTYLAIGGAFFFLAIQLQTGLGYTALEAGAATVPVTVLMVIGSPIAGRISATNGPRLLLTAGPVIAALGMLGFTRVDEGAGYLTTVLPAVLVLGVGLAVMVAPLTASVLASVDPTDVGVASAVNNAVARVGGLLATSMLPLLAGITGDIGGPSFVDGFDRAMIIAAGLSLVGGVIGYVTVDRCVATHTDVPAGPTAGCVQRSLPAAVAADGGS